MLSVPVILLEDARLGSVVSPNQTVLDHLEVTVDISSEIIWLDELCDQGNVDD